MVVVDAAATRLAAGTAYYPHIFQEDMPGQVGAIQIKCNTSINGGCKHSCVSPEHEALLHAIHGAERYALAACQTAGQQSVTVQVPLERWDIENTALNRLEGRQPTRFAAFMKGSPMPLPSAAQNT